MAGRAARIPKEHHDEIIGGETVRPATTTATFGPKGADRVRYDIAILK
jgi:hypothetical protein